MWSFELSDRSVGSASLAEIFEANLGNSKKEELADTKVYEDLKKGKTDDIQKGQDLEDAKNKL